MDPTRPILIATASFDEHAYGPVRELLARRGFSVVVYRTDKLLSGAESFGIDLKSNVPSIKYEGISIHPSDIGAAWYRKVGSFGLPDADSQLAKQLYMNNEVRALHDTIWPQFYPEDIWLSSPNRIAIADRKLGQLLMAREVGFAIPDTVVASDWETISHSLIGASNDNLIVVKMMRGVISDGNHVKTMPTTILDADRVTALRQYASPFPGIYQAYVPKAREWRITVVGTEVFPVAIYTEPHAKDDWRKHQNTGGVEFRACPLPADISNLCIAYLQAFSLGFGAFDLVEDPDGRFVFLECNPNGQYGWLEEDLGLRISEAIASRLIAIAHSKE